MLRNSSQLRKSVKVVLYYRIFCININKLKISIGIAICWQELNYLTANVARRGIAKFESTWKECHSSVVLSYVPHKQEIRIGIAIYWRKLNYLNANAYQASTQRISCEWQVGCIQ